MKKFILRVSLVILAFICFASRAMALDLQSEEANYKVSIPGTWKLTFQNQAGFSVTGTNTSRSMTLLIANARSGKLDASTTAAIEKGFQRAGMEKISSRLFTIDGIPAYEVVQRIGKSPHATVMVDHQIIADNKLYAFHASIMGGDASADADMQEGLNSFHFLRPPQPPSSTTFDLPYAKTTVLGVLIVGAVVLALCRKFGYKLK